jgi:putative transposase
MTLRKSRKTIRLQGYDYSQDGWYFVTFCINNFEERLGIISNEGKFIPNELGIIVENEWNETPKIRPEVELDMFQIMPNHFHAIVVIGGKEKLPNLIGFPDTSSPIAKFKSPVRTIGSIIRGFKGASTKKMRLIFNNLEDKIWQYNYYERIIRDENELNRIRKYIDNNPQKWQDDKEHFKKLLEKMNKR